VHGPSSRRTGLPSDIDILVTLNDPAVGRLAELAERLSRRVGRDVQPVRLTEAETSSILMADIIDRGRVLVDQEGRWPSLLQTAERWQRRAERSLPAAMDERELNHC
jgi:predicted nucleotidyltransferase